MTHFTRLCFKACVPLCPHPNFVLPFDSPSALAKGRSLDDISIENNQDDDNDVHDYEYIDEDQLDNIRRVYQEQSINMGVKGKPSNTI